MSTPKDARESSRPVPPNAALDNALFPPRLDLLILPEAADNGAGPDYGEILETICGVADDSQPVEQYDGSLGVTQAFVRAHQSPVAQVQWNDDLAATYTNPGNVSGVRWGSGTMVGPDLFLTCGHLFDADPNGWVIPRQNGTSSAITPQQAARSMHLNFDFQVDQNGVQRAEVSYPITQLIEFRLGGLDMALCRIGGSPGRVHGWTEFATTNPAEGDMLAIIGHPAGRPKRIEAGPATTVEPAVLRYNDIDTLGGNSGSGILHAATGRLVGVHTNGGCNVARTGSNSGVAIAALVAASPTLRKLTPSSGTGTARDSTRVSDLLWSTFAEDFTLHSRYAGDFPVVPDIFTRIGADIGVVPDLDTGVGRDVNTWGAGDAMHTWGGEAILDPGSITTIPWQHLGGVRPLVQAASHIQLGEVAAEPTQAEVLQHALEQAIGTLRGIQSALDDLSAQER